MRQIIVLPLTCSLALPRKLPLFLLRPPPLLPEAIVPPSSRRRRRRQGQQRGVESRSCLLPRSCCRDGRPERGLLVRELLPGISRQLSEGGREGGGVGGGGLDWRRGRRSSADEAGTREEAAGKLKQENMIIKALNIWQVYPQLLEDET